MKNTFLVLGTVAGVAAALGFIPETPVASAETPANVTTFNPLGSGLLFEENRGQWPAPVRFSSRNAGYRLWLFDNRVELHAETPTPGQPAFAMALEGTEAARLSGRDPGSAEIHYFRGSSSDSWVRNVETFNKVLFAGVYPGIDMLFYGSGGLHEYDFRLLPGADPSRIAMRFSGAAPPVLSASGDLEIATGVGRITIQAPIAYQQTAAGRKRVASRFRIDPVDSRSAVVRFELGDFDPELELVIDPVLKYASYLGGGLSEQVTAVGTDADGNIFVTGTTNSTSFPLAGNSVQAELAGELDLFVAKLAPSGQTLLAATYLGGLRDDAPFRMEIDDEGRPVVGGSTRSDDFPTANAFQFDYGGGTRDGFVVKLASDLSELVFSTYFGGSATDEVSALALGSGGRVWLGGLTRSEDFHFLNPLQSERSGGDDNFFARLGPDGSTLEFSTLFGGSRGEGVLGLDVDSEGFLYATGFTASQDYPLMEPFQEEKGSGDDLFLTVIDSSDQLHRSTFFGGNGTDIGFTVDVADDGTIVIGGESSSTNFPLRDAVQLTNAGGTDAVLARFDADVSELLFSTFLGGSSGDTIRGVLLDGPSAALVTGFTQSSNFPLAGTTLVQQFGTETFLARVDTAAPALVFSSRYGGNGTDSAAALGSNGNGSIFIAGTTSSTDLLTVDPFQAAAGSQGVFRSTDGAENWQAAGIGLADPNIRAVAVAPSSPLTLFAAAGSAGVAKSTDGSATWEATGLDDASVSALVVDPADADTIFAGGFGGVFKTTDGGEAWELFNDGLPFDTVTALAIDPGNTANLYAGTASRGVFASSDGGETWSARNGGLDDDGKRVFSVAVDASDSNRLYLGTNGKVFISTTQGQLWDPTSLVNVGPVTGLVVDRSSGNVWASGFNNVIGSMVARSADQGVTWLAQPLGSFENPLQHPITSLALSPTDGQTLYAGTAGGGVYKTTDGGQTASSWSPMNAGLTSLQIQAVAASSNNGVLAATPSGSDGLLVGYESENTFFLPQVANGRAGIIRFQTTLILMNTGADSHVKVEFFGVDAGANVVPIEFTFPGLGTGSVFEFDLKRGAALEAQTDGLGPVRVGYARVTAGDGVDGTAVFTRTDATANQPLFEGGVPSVKAHTDFVFLLDSLGDQNTGVALVNTASPVGAPNEGEADIRITLFDEDNNKLQEISVVLKPGEHRAKFVNELFPDIAILASEMRGILRVECDQPVAAVTLRQREPEQTFPNDVPTLTPFPVVLPNSLSEVSYFPQVGHGTFANSIFQTGFILANGSNTFGIVLLEFFSFDSQTGEAVPMEVTLDGFGGGPQTDSVFNFFLSSNEFRFLKTVTIGEEPDPLQVGYARLTTQLGVGGTAVFSETTLDSGITLFEAGVTKTLERRRFSIFLDSLGKKDTGLAMVNTSEEEAATVQLRLFDLDCNLIAEREVVLQAGEHLPRFIFEIFNGVPEAREMQGVVAVDSSLPLAAVTLRQSNDLSIEFPIEVPTLTIFPVVPGVP